MSASERICETCVYCTFAGNCDRYDKPLASIEQPACNSYEIHPLLAENEKLRELVRDMWQDGMCECDECGAFAQGQYHCTECEYHFPDRMKELGIEVAE